MSVGKAIVGLTQIGAEVSPLEPPILPLRGYLATHFDFSFTILTKKYGPTQTPQTSHEQHQEAEG